MTQLVQVDTFADLPLAQFVQLQLKEVGIESWLENATLVAWFWQVGFAVGGIKLFVKAEDLAPARETLTAPAADVPRPTEFCPQCHEALLPSWETCWQCAQVLPEQPSEMPEADRMRREDWERIITSITVAVVGLATFMACGPIWLLFVVACFAVVKLFFEYAAAENSGAIAAEPQPDAEGSAPTRRRSELADDIAIRAWRAAIIGFLYFPPLILYGSYLAFRIKPRLDLLAAFGKRRRLGAQLVALATILFWGMFIFIVYDGRPLPPAAQKSPWSLER